MIVATGLVGVGLPRNGLSGSQPEGRRFKSCLVAGKVVRSLGEDDIEFLRGRVD